MKSKRLLRGISILLFFVCILIIGIFALVGCGDNKESTQPVESDPIPIPTPEPEPVPEPEEPILEYINIYFEPPIKNYEVLRGYYDGNPDLYYNIFTGQFVKHYGVDLTGDEDSPVLSMYNGVVLEVIQDSQKGYVVIVDYGENLIVTFSSLESVCVEENQTLAIGDSIGTMGTNRDEIGFTKHLCLEISLNNVSIDPTPYIEGEIYREVIKE